MHGSCRPVVVVSRFDGPHIGHCALLRHALRIAAGERRPCYAVILDENDSPRLSAVVDRCTWAISSGSHGAVVLPVDRKRRDVGRELAQHVVDRLRPASVFSACTAVSRIDPVHQNMLSSFGRLGLSVIEVPRAIAPDGEPVSTALVRDAVVTGDLRTVTTLLGRPLSFDGHVVEGARLGRTLGFPTANLVPCPRRVLPAAGVYAAIARLESGAHLPAAVNVGVRPTVDENGQLLVEAHLLDFDGDLYGQLLRIDFLRRLRNERTFDSLQSLTEQLKIDVECARLVVHEALRAGLPQGSPMTESN